MDAHPGAVEPLRALGAHPSAMEIQLGAMEAHPESCMLERWAHPKALKPPLSNGCSSINPGAIDIHPRAIYTHL
jgi:hypothetical protein